MQELSIVPVTVLRGGDVFLSHLNNRRMINLDECEWHDIPIAYVCVLKSLYKGLIKGNSEKETM